MSVQPKPTHSEYGSVKVRVSSEVSPRPCLSFCSYKHRFFILLSKIQLHVIASSLNSIHMRILDRPSPLSREPMATGSRITRQNPSSPRNKVAAACTCLRKPGSVPCRRHGYALPTEDKTKRTVQGYEEVLKRALTPPSAHRTISFRWWNFRPTPSRLSTMSTA